eukprot:1943870-Prymnesium_polylepis.1
MGATRAGTAEGTVRAVVVPPVRGRPTELGGRPPYDDGGIYASRPSYVGPGWRPVNNDAHRPSVAPLMDWSARVESVDDRLGACGPP